MLHSAVLLLTKVAIGLKIGRHIFSIIHMNFSILKLKGRFFVKIKILFISILSINKNFILVL